MNEADTWSLIAFKEHIERLINERDRLYLARFTAAEEAVKAAFASTEKAVAKSEEAQRSYNERSNEFRGQLDDQAKTLLGKAEYYTAHKNLEENIEKLENRENEMERMLANLQGRMWAIPLMISGVMWIIGLAVAAFVQYRH